MSYISNFVKGILIGSGAILPGISSGVLCVIFGIYEDLLNRIFNFFKNPLDNFKFFLPLIIGGCIGVVLVGKLLLCLFTNFNMATCFCFMGLILGCLPSILMQAHMNSRSSINRLPNRFIHYLCFIFTFSFSIYLILLEQSINSETVATLEANTTNFFDLSLSGFLMSAGIVIPGVSSSVILMLLDSYNLYLQSIANIDFAILIPMGIGVILGSFLFLKCIQFLFKYFKSYTYYAIAGFTLASLFVLYPGIVFDLYGLFSVILFVFSFFLARRLEKTN